MALPNGVIVWSWISSKYTQEACKNVTTDLEREYDGLILERKVSTPFSIVYHPELYIFSEFNEEQAYFYHSQNGLLRWIFELWRIDIITEASL